MSNPETAARKMQYLRSIGLHVALDDFGTGYSSLAYLTHFPCYCLKIDKSFVDNITTDENSVRVVRAIIHLAHGLGMVALAEGVETPEQLAQLQDMGCDQVQGYLLGKPMPQAALRDVIARNC
jgi:EAL domain-containing protein (putative c-di-GMP-specific phosphodiesterase class I)